MAKSALDGVFNAYELVFKTGASFASPQLTIDSLMRAQSAFDADYADQYDDYTIPKGCEAWRGSEFGVVF